MMLLELLMLKRNKKSPLKNKASAVNTLISNETKITGNVNFSGTLYIDGHVQGDVIADELDDSLLTIGQNGYIEGEVKVPHIVVYGKVKGDAHALEHIELMASAKIDGNVYYKLIEMAMGAEVNGQMVRKDEKPKLLGHQKVPKEAAKEQQQLKEETSPLKKEPSFKSDENVAAH